MKKGYENSMHVNCVLLQLPGEIQMTHLLKLITSTAASSNLKNPINNYYVRG